MVSFSGIFTRTYPLWWLLLPPENGSMPIITHCFSLQNLIEGFKPWAGCLHGPAPFSLPHLASFTPGSLLCVPHVGCGAEHGCWCILTLAHIQRGEAGTLAALLCICPWGHSGLYRVPAGLPAWIMGCPDCSGLSWTQTLYGGVWMPLNSSFAFQELFFSPLIVFLQD